MEDFDLGVTVKGLAPGQRVFGRFALKKLVGRGGMGVVWQAWDEKLERDVALKFLPEMVAQDKEAINDLKRETRRALELTHPRIVRIFDFVQDERSAAISMEYVDGESLAAMKLERPNGHFEVEELRPIVTQLCEALSYAHGEAQLIHRDLKPANLMINSRGELKITDFGISATVSDSTTRISKVASTSGTPVYMSPQQMMGDKPAVTDDIYSVGATLYELLTGKPPFYSGNVLLQVQSKVAPSMTERRAELSVDGTEIPAEWEQSIASCLSKDSSRRPQSVTELAETLGLTRRSERSIGATHETAKPARMEQPSEPVLQTVAPDTPLNKALLFAVLASVVAVGLVGWYFVGVYLPAQREAEANQVRLANARGGLIIKTDPAGAEVRVGGMAVEKTPLTMKEVRLGKYPVTIRAAGYDPVDLNLEVKENEFTDTGLIALKRSLGKLALSSDPAGQEFALTGGLLEKNARRGKTPADFDLPTGKYEIIFKRPGWPDIVKAVDLELGQRVPVSVLFPQGGIEIATEPSGLPFRLTGGDPVHFDQSGVTPVKYAMPSGEYTVAFTRDGWLPQSRQVEVKIGTTANVTAKFPSARLAISSEPQPVGFVVAGGPTGQIRKSGNTPLTIELPAGNYSVTLAREGWQPHEQKVGLLVDATTEVTAQFPSGELDLESDPAGLDFVIVGVSGIKPRYTVGRDYFDRTDPACARRPAAGAKNLSAKKALFSDGDTEPRPFANKAGFTFDKSRKRKRHIEDWGNHSRHPVSKHTNLARLRNRCTYSIHGESGCFLRW